MVAPTSGCVTRFSHCFSPAATFTSVFYEDLVDDSTRELESLMLWIGVPLVAELKSDYVPIHSAAKLSDYVTNWQSVQEVLGAEADLAWMLKA